MGPHPNETDFSYRWSKRWSSSSFPGPDYDSFRRFHFYRRRPSRLVWFSIGAVSATVFIMHKEAKENDRAAYWKHCHRVPVSGQQEGSTATALLADSLPNVPGNGTGAPPSPSSFPYSHPHHHSHWSWGFARERFPPPPPLPQPQSQSQAQFQQPLQTNAAIAGATSIDTNGNVSGQVQSDPVPPTASIGSLSMPNQNPAQPQANHGASSNAHPPAPWGFESKFEQQRREWEQERARLLSKAQDTMSELSESTLDSLSSTVEALKAKLTEHRMEREKQQKMIEKELEEQKKKPVRFV